MYGLDKNNHHYATLFTSFDFYNQKGGFTTRKPTSLRDVGLKSVKHLLVTLDLLFAIAPSSPTP